MCRVAALNGAAFEWMHHAPLLLSAGVSEEGLETVKAAMPGYVGKDGEKGLSKRLWSVLKFVDCMTKDIKVPDDIFGAVRELLDERQVVELGESLFLGAPYDREANQFCEVMTTAGYNAVSRFLVAMDVAELKDVKVGDTKLSSKL